MRPKIDAALQSLGGVILGKDHQIKLILACVFSGGHVLLEDVPGVGKTTLAKTLQAVLGLTLGRIQFNSDITPFDILGTSVYEGGSGFTFHPGPIFAHFVLADEINSGLVKTQRAFLEAMEEGQVTMDGKHYPLPDPFFVIATQNPISEAGTHPLPSAQLERFMMRLSLGHPDEVSEKRLLRGDGAPRLPAPCLTAAEVMAIRKAIAGVALSEPVIDYLYRLLAYSRTSRLFCRGLSPRVGLSLMRASRAFAYMAGRDFVMPEDVQAVLPHVVNHNLHIPGQEHRAGGREPGEILLNSVAVT